MAYSTIEDPSAYFQTALYTGNGSTQSITNDGNSDLQPDWVWVKNRNDSYHNLVFDSSRGVNNRLATNLTIAEDTGAGYGTVSAFNSDGFSVTNGGNTGTNTLTYVAWQWKCNGGTTSTNTDGDINSTVQVNQDAGFSIVTYQPSNTTSRNIGHGLGATPGLIIIRNRTRVENWRLWHHSIGQGGAILDNETAYNSGTSNLVNTVTSTYFNVGGDFSVNGGYPIVAWCFAEKQGYSKFGKYYGNSHADGAFVYTGFKPAWVMVKKSSDAGTSWMIQDSKRSITNPVTHRLKANSNVAEATNIDSMDFLSNGFKIRVNDSIWNTAGTYIYMAFAENPFVANGIPTTAR